MTEQPTMTQAEAREALNLLVLDVTKAQPSALGRLIPYSSLKGGCGALAWALAELEREDDS